MRCDVEASRSSIIPPPAQGWWWDHPPVRFATFEELRATGRPDSEWLTSRERAELDRLRHPVRRNTWRCGRLLAKGLLLVAAPQPIDGPERIEILSRGADGRSIRPEIRIDGRRVPWCLSIAHSDAAALVAASFEPETMVGVDVVRPEAVRPGFLETWFTERERCWLAAQPAETVAGCWGLKEAVYKACQQGEAFVPRQIEILPNGSEGVTCMYEGIDLTANSHISTEWFDEHLAIVVVVERPTPP